MYCKWINQAGVCVCRTTSALGTGQFGEVWRGFIDTPSGEKEVAVKRLKEGSSQTEKVRFLQEAVVMKQFLHPNILRVVGVVTQTEPVSMGSMGGSHPPITFKNAVMWHRVHVTALEVNLHCKLVSECQRFVGDVIYVCNNASVYVEFYIVVHACHDSLRLLVDCLLFLLLYGFCT